jgi:hypothetical protein
MEDPRLRWLPRFGTIVSVIAVEPSLVALSGALPRPLLIGLLLAAQGRMVGRKGLWMSPVVSPALGPSGRATEAVQAGDGRIEARTR